MKSVECLVILSVWACLSVGGVRVPSSWNVNQGQESFGNLNDGINPNHRFGNVHSQRRYHNRYLDRRNFMENVLEGNPGPRDMYGTLQASAIEDFLRYPQQQMMVFNQNGQYIVPQNPQPQNTIPNENKVFQNGFSLPPPIATGEILSNNPPQRNAQYTEPIQNSQQQNSGSNNNIIHYEVQYGPPPLQDNNIRQYQTSQESAPVPTRNVNHYQKTQKLPLGSTQNESFDKYHTLPSDVSRITPSSSRSTHLNGYKQLEPTKLKQPNLKRFTQNYKPTIHKEYAQIPSRSYGSRLNIFPHSLKGHVSHKPKFIITATEEDSTLSPIDNQQNPLHDHNTKKEPIVFVTEGYTNVLVQGPNNKKKYQKLPLQNKEESRKIFNKKKLENDGVSEKNNEDEDNEEKLPRTRKVTKVYKIQENDGVGDDNNAGGSIRNLVESGVEKPGRYLRPSSQTGSERRSRLKDLPRINYRDDKLHEPIDDHDQQREDNEQEREGADREREDDDRERTNDEEKITEEEVRKDKEGDEDDVEDDTSNGNPKSKEENENSSDSEETEESDEEDAENEEEESQQEVPYSEHADPKPIPTKPNYPGAGLWAKPGLKHRPYVSQHRFLKPPEEQRPDGYDVFEDLQKYFETQKDQFGSTFGEKINPSVNPFANSPTLNQIAQIKAPKPVNTIPVVYDPFTELNGGNLQQQPPAATLYNNYGTNVNTGHNQQVEASNNYNNNYNNNNNNNNDNNNEENSAGNEESEEEGDEDEESDEEGNNNEFVPMQLYTQVRKSDNEEHEPYNPAEHGRLREVIKDSKIQTVYSEEGYEDAAYDHAGHEKKAENDQGLEQFEREKVEKGKPKEVKEDDSDGGQSNKVAVIEEPLEDSLPSASIYPSLPKENLPFTVNNKTQNIGTSKIPNKKQTTNNNNFITTQEVKTTQVKDKNNGDVQLEIESEVKVIVQPNNSTKAHKYVKIYPKVFREYSKEDLEDDEDEEINNNSKEELSTNEETIASLASTERINSNDTLEKYEDILKTPESSDLENHLPLLEQILITSEKPVIDSDSTSEENYIRIVVTTERPKVIVKVLDDEEALKNINDQYAKTNSELQRKKRSVELDPKDLDIDITFIDKINHTFAEKKPDVIDVDKYPYYALSDLNENSPLRYAENMGNIPKKVGGELSFYKMADKNQCPDLPQNIDPVPEHVKNADKTIEQGEDEEDENEDDDDEESEESSDQEKEDDDDSEESIVDQKHPPTPKAPRIKIGDKIECFKNRYFGVNPLDSPFFYEETVGPVKSIFEELDKKSSSILDRKNNDNKKETSEISENINNSNEIFNHKEKKDERKFETKVKDKAYYSGLQESVQMKEGAYDNLQKSVEKSNNVLNEKINTLFSIEKENENAESVQNSVKVMETASSERLAQKLHNILPTPASLVTLITTPKYTIDLKPRNIYDQIKLLDHLPEDEVEDVNKRVEISTRRTETTKIEEKPIIVAQEITTEAAEGFISTTIPKVETKVTTEAVPEIMKRIDGNKASSRREPKVLAQEQEVVNEKLSPDTEALTRRRFRPRRPIYQIFDVSQYLTTTPFSIINPIPSTVLPKHKVISEVFYKDEIKPNEQLTVFADILNNIKNSSHTETIPLQSASDFAEPDSVTISNLEATNIIPKTETSPNIRVKKYQMDTSNDQNLIDRRPVKNQAPTEKHFNARFPETYEDHHRIHSTTNRNVVNLIFNNPDNIGYVDNNPGFQATNIYNDDEDNINQYNNPAIAKTGIRKVLKRRRNPTTKGTTSTTLKTTTNINIPNESSTPNNHKPYAIDYLEDTEQVVGLVPPTKFQYKTIVEDSDGTGSNVVPKKVYEYRTIPPSFITESTANNSPAPVTEIVDEADIPILKMNKYYFLGLKPPLNQRAHLYSDFLINKKGTNNKIAINNIANSNVVKRRVSGVGHGHFRFKREAARTAYSEVSRNRGRQNEGLEKATTPEDVDDYVPHRPKNYHYDEKTGKIVYHNKPKVEEKEEEDEEAEYEEIEETPGRYLERVEDATHPTPEKVTTKQLLATATPPPEGKGLLDFVAKLKNNPNYEYIPDPTTQDPKKVTTTTEGTTVDPKSTNPPEFLSILSKVKSNTNYKFIEDPKESKSKTKAKATTPKPEEEEEEQEEDDEEEEENFQNSPGDQGQELSNIQIFDINEYIPKVKPVSPKTTIDYSKYKTIERPHTRHNMSSRYNSEEHTNLEEVVTVRKPLIMEEKESIDRPVVSEERIVHDKEVESVSEKDVSTTTQKIVQFRRGTRPTTQRTTAETVEPIEPVITRKSSIRRKPVPSGFRTTRRPTTTHVTEAAEKVEKVYPQDSATERTYPDTFGKAKRVYRRRPVRIRHTTERHEEDDEAIDTFMRRSLKHDDDDDFEDDDVRSEFEKEFLGI